MSESHQPSVVSEKTANSDHRDAPSKQGWFPRRKTAKNRPHGEKEEPTVNVKSDEPSFPPISLAQLFRYSTPFELFLNAIGLIAAATAGAAQPLMSLLFGRLTQEFVKFAQAIGTQQVEDTQVQEAAASFRHAAALNASYLVSIGLGMFLCTFVYMYTWVYTGEINAKRIRERYLKAVLRQDVAWFDDTGAGEVATRIQTDTHLVQQGMSEKVALCVNYISSFITGFIVAYVRNWRLALALSSGLPCIALTGALMDGFMSKRMQQSLKHVADGGTLAEEVISTIRTAQAFGSQQKLSHLYEAHINKSRKAELKYAVYNGIGVACFFFIVYCIYALAFSFGTTLILSGHADSGDVVNVILAILIGSFSLAMLTPESQAIAKGRGAAAKLYATIDRIPAIDSADPSGLKPNHVDGEIVFENVNFSYPARPTVPVVKDLSLTFRSGQTAALVGASGSGKSTVVSLVERFYDPLSGSVRLDGNNLKDLNLKWLRSQIGLVSQEPTLFATTIRGNVEHGLMNTKWENATPEEKFKLVKEACIKANADGFVSKLPDGYDTMVGERGFLLSGGQKQRIAIARAIVSDPRILLLDEATSALDTQSEGVVQDALDKAAAGRTTIAIAHRLSTIKDADIIYVMGDGRVLEQGTHNELLEDDKSAYSRLVQAQKLREAGEHRSTFDDNSGASAQDIEKAIQEEVPLGRSHTGRSLASDIIEQKRRENDQEERKSADYSIPYLFKRIGLLNRESWHSYTVGALAAAVTGMVYPAYGIVFAKGIEAFAQEDRGRIRHLGDRTALWFFVIAIISTLSIGIQIYLFGSSAARLAAKQRTIGFKAILRQDIEYFDRDEHSTGSLTSSLSDNPQKLNGLAGVTLGTILQGIVTLIAGSAVGLAFGWKLALVGIACTPILVSTGYIRLRVVILKDEANKEAHESSAQLACEAAGSIRTVAALTREDDCCALYSKSLEGPLHRSNRTAFWSNALFSISQATVFFVIALVFWYGSRLVSQREYSTFQFFVVLMGTTFSAIEVGNVFSFVPDISSAKGAAVETIKLIDSIPEIDAESPDGKAVNREHARGQIRFDNVHFRYPTRPGVRVLRGLSLTVQPGTYIALVGQSGCGKSTVIQLIERFYDPLHGSIHLDGENIADLNIQDYRKHIALVSQEPTLYAGTVRFNILLGAIKPEAEVTQEEIEAACRDANILDFIQSLPDGFDTQVGGKGSQLSGGQKQRIAIARALLRNPKVLLLDEATSALDSHSEVVVQEALDQAAKGRTTIAIAHRLSTIQNADCIYFVKEGVVSEYGTHDQLLSKRGDYFEFVQLQALSKQD
ncbi:hypothetical protein HGRIS_000343 [Hohenbuehelia grisea]|uniref:P-loop containing nucleoside triphosphate hydrolase protein n=1 Tax=Hohenbuehelia grisea TaxID=104357 RepID=A0ABR3JRD5_9AGAR